MLKYYSAGGGFCQPQNKVYLGGQAFFFLPLHSPAMGQAEQPQPHEVRPFLLLRIMLKTAIPISAATNTSAAIVAQFALIHSAMLASFPGAGAPHTALPAYSIPKKGEKTRLKKYILKKR